MMLTIGLKQLRPFILSKMPLLTLSCQNARASRDIASADLNKISLLKINKILLKSNILCDLKNINNKLICLFKSYVILQLLALCIL